MKKTKEKHTSPQEYRIIWSAGDSVTNSTQYYNVFHSSEALADIYHTFAKKKIHAKEIVISSIEEHCRFSDKWHDRKSVCLEHFSNDFDILIEEGNWVQLEVSAEENIILRR
jgi:hypothetical protein